MRILNATHRPVQGGRFYDITMELEVVGDASGCRSLGDLTPLTGTYAWTFGTGTPGRNPANPNDNLPTGSASVGSSGYPSAGTPTWYALDLDRGASPPALGHIELTYQTSAPAGYGPSLWVSDDGSSWTEIIDTATWYAALSGPDLYDLTIPEDYKNSRYIRFRTDDLFVSGFWSGTTWTLIQYRECIP